MRKTVILVIVLSILFLIITMLQDELIPNEKLQYENKRIYPLGVNPTEYDEFYYNEDYDE